jgi:maleylacetoacetate isomerase/maleylpyruvate isomerase
MSLTLYSYFRSSASYRVRIALNLKGIAYDIVPVNLLKAEQLSPEYRTINPQGMLPALVEGGNIFTQSLSIMEYLEERTPKPPLLPADAAGRARVRALAQIIACEMAPLNNIGTMNFLRNELAQGDAARTAWYAHWIAKGFSAFEALLSAGKETGAYCHGDTPTIADCCLVPQLFNAKRYECDLTPYPRLQAIAARCEEHPAFIAAHPSKQPDAQTPH